MMARAANAALPKSEMNCVLTVNPKANTPLGSDGRREDIPAVLLVGGMGTRLQAILPSTPKPLAPVGKVPFLQLLVLQLRAQGIRRIVMCTGHLADQIEEEFGDGHKWDVAIEYSKESRPLGTAGAVRFAERYLPQAAEFLVMNGDSFLELDFPQFIRFHRKHGGLISMAVRRVPDAARYGTVQLDTLNRVVGFSEKTGARVPGIVNGGVYIFNRAILEHLPKGPASLEQDVFPVSLEHGVYALEQHGMFIDIGTPEDYERAQALYESLYQAALPGSQFGPQDRRPR
jgi:D-glycero-alpha-D-manno-heptose 1-phosphate guanylyltransferase